MTTSTCECELAGWLAIASYQSFADQSPNPYLSIPKYRRYEKRHKNLAAHVSPAFRVEAGDQVTVGQCRPLSKTVRFNVLRVQANKAKGFSKF